MSISAHFNHRCDIQRPYSGSEDAHGLSDDSEQYAASGVRFRLVEKKERVWYSEASEAAIVTTYKGLFGPDVDLQERDSVVNVVLENGTVLEETFIIESVITRRSRPKHHLSVELRRVS